MRRFDFQRFLADTGLSLAALASSLRVAQGYLQAAALGQDHLTPRDEESCRALWRRLTQGEQMELPFGEAPETFTRAHARDLARVRAGKAAGR